MNKRARPGLWLVGLVVLLALAGVAGWLWTRHVDTPPGEAGEVNTTPEPVVRESTVQPGQQVLVVHGQWRAAREATVRTQVGGAIAAWEVQDGDVVEQGQMLGQLSLGPMQARRGRAQARLNIARHHARTLRQLVAGGYEPPERLTAAEAELDSAQRELDAIEQEAELRRIRAPIAGQLRIRAEPGAELVQGSDVAHVADRDPLQAVSRVRGEHSARLRAGMPVRVELPGVGTVQGHVVSASKISGDGGVRAEIEIPNPRHVQPASRNVEFRIPL